MKFIWVLIGVILTLPVYSKQLKVDVAAESAILINAKTGDILYEKNAHQSHFPASTTKIATAIYALHKQKALDIPVTATEDPLGVIRSDLKKQDYSKYPAYRIETGSTHIGIKVGEILSFRTLLYGLMLASGNDAANVIASHLSGDINRFMQELNSFLKQNGIHNTHFCNPHGLHHPEHITTAYDMALLAKLAIQNPDFREIVKTVSYPRSQTNKQEETLLVQSNRLLKRGQFFYPKALGIKTGYTSAAGYTLVAGAEQDGRLLIAVLLNCKELHQRYRDAIALFEAAFNESKIRRVLFSKEFDSYSILVKGGAAPLEAHLTEDVVLDYYPSEEPKCKALLAWDNLKMPICKGQVVGAVRLVTQEGSLLKSVPLYATQDIPKTFYFKCLEFVDKGRILFWKKEVVIIFLMLITTLSATFMVLRKSKDQKAE